MKVLLGFFRGFFSEPERGFGNAAADCFAAARAQRSVMYFLSGCRDWLMSRLIATTR